MADANKARRSEPSTENVSTGSNFLRAIIENDLRSDKHGGRIVTRFPPEPNGYLHLGHAKSICLNFGLAQDYKGACNLRFDDTNPETEEVEFVNSIKQDIRWLEFDWDDREYYASDYFQQLYDFAEHLIETGKAYVDSLTEDEIREYRGTVTEAGKPSPYRDRTISENLDLFRRMRAGEFPDGAHVLRAKIDLGSNNMKMRDPLLYRIRHAHHYRTADDWCIYPMYDFAHPLSDAIEGVTHSLCTLEFDNNRELYDWVLDNTVGEPRPHQYEFARMNLDYTVMSKRKLLRLVSEGHVSGWDDPRMPTLAGFRRRGVRPTAIRAFCEAIGVAKTENRVEMSLLEHTIRDDLNFDAPRVMAVLRPLKLIITNYPNDETEWLDAPYWPHDVPRDGSRKIPFGRELYIDRTDFRDDPPTGYYRLAPGREVRLRYGYFVTCTEVMKNDAGEVTALHCTYDPDTRGGQSPDGRKVRGTIHWVDARHALPAEIRIYDRLFRVSNPDDEDVPFVDLLNDESLVVPEESVVEPSVADDDFATRYQFEREGYFWRDPVDSTKDRLVFNRIVALRDTWRKIEGRSNDTSRRALEGDGSPSVVPGVGDAPPQHEDPTGGAALAAPSVDDRISGLSDRQQSRFQRLKSEHGLSDDDALILAENPDLLSYFEKAVVAYDAPSSIAKWVVNDVLREANERSLASVGVSPRQLADLVRLVDENTLSMRLAREVFEETIGSGDDPSSIVDVRGLRQVSDRVTLEPVIDEVIESNSDRVIAYRQGKRGLIGFFMGQVMQRTSGKANPELARGLLEARLDDDGERDDNGDSP